MEFLIILAVASAFGIYSYAKAKKNRMSQAIGFALMPGLWLGALTWCLLAGQFGLIAVILFVISIGVAYFYLLPSAK